MKLAFVLLSLPGLALAQYAPPTGYALIGNIPGQPVQQAGAMPAANWDIIVSGAPGPVNPLVPMGTGYESINKSVVIAVGGDSVGIGQYANGTACDTASGLPSEFDVNIAPGKAAKPAVPPALSSVKTLSLTGSVVIERYGVTPGAAVCKVNKTSATLGVVLADDAVSPHQRLFYTVQLFDSLGAPTRPGGWYWTGNHVAAGFNEWGYSDIPASYGVADPTVGDHATALTFDTLPKITALIAAGSDGLDTNLADWSVVGTSFGQAHWGDAYLATAWSGFVPLAQ